MPTRLSGHPNRLAIVPSMLDVDFGHVAEEITALQQAGAHRLQWDVMDGQFVPRPTHGPDIVKRHAAEKGQLVPETRTVSHQVAVTAGQV